MLDLYGMYHSLASCSESCFCRAHFEVKLEDKNMNAVQFPTRTGNLCRMRAHLNCSYVSNFNTRGADRVVVSASDWQAGGTGLIPRRSKPVIFRIKPIDNIDNWRCNAMRHAHWHASYIKLTRMSHRPQYIIQR